MIDEHRRPECNCGSRQCGLIFDETRTRFWCAECLFAQLDRLDVLEKALKKLPKPKEEPRSCYNCKQEKCIRTESDSLKPPCTRHLR